MGVGLGVDGLYAMLRGFLLGGLFVLVGGVYG